MTAPIPDRAVRDAVLSQFGGVVGSIVDDVMAKRLPEIERAVRASERARCLRVLREYADDVARASAGSLPAEAIRNAADLLEGLLP